MSLRIIRYTDGLTMPWKNGGGTTRELLREAGDPPSLRISVADVKADGPFSRFPDVDRVIALVDGRGFALDFADTSVTLDRPGLPFAFPGDVPCDCRLLDGPVRDLNVMVDRRVHALSVVPITSTASITPTAPIANSAIPTPRPPERVLVIALGPVTLCSSSGEAAPETHALAPLDIALLDGPQHLSGSALLVTLTPRAPD
jgi:hypothetical protein